MAAFALVFAALAALLHFYIFYLEVPAFGSAAFCRVFRIAPEQLSDVQAAFQNLGVYNLRPLQNSFSPHSQNPNTGFRLFPPPITPNFTQIPP